jgi:hypothetical protein
MQLTFVLAQEYQKLEDQLKDWFGQEPEEDLSDHENKNTALMELDKFEKMDKDKKFKDDIKKWRGRLIKRIREGRMQGTDPKRIEEVGILWPFVVVPILIVFFALDFLFIRLGKLLNNKFRSCLEKMSLMTMITKATLSARRPLG